ncbi:predicted protein [Streptomyces sp. C]|nr:predicted protein [Streptomyces sp. C]
MTSHRGLGLGLVYRRCGCGGYQHHPLSARPSPDHRQRARTWSFAADVQERSRGRFGFLQNGL